MNTANNERSKKSVDSIRKAYLNLVIAREDISSITVSDICKKAGINRTTFYSHYIDIDDLLNSIYEWMMNEFLAVFSEDLQNSQHSFDFLKLFKHIKDNQIFYKIYFKLGFDFKNIFIKNDSFTRTASSFYKNTRYIDYHIEFFSAGITAIIQKWLDRGCEGSPEEITNIIVEEYRKKNT